jgi:putative transposase
MNSGPSGTGRRYVYFWAALHEVYGMTRVQRCWGHKTANDLNAMPKSVQPKAHLIDIWMAQTKADATFDFSSRLAA